MAAIRLRSAITCLTIGIVVLSGGSAPAWAAIRYVKAGAAGTNSGLDWTNAHPSLQTALIRAIAGDEIWVAVGEYRPSSPGGRTSTFQLRNGVAIIGGFRGLAGDEGINDVTTRPLDASNRPVLASELNGDLGGNDLPNFGNNGDNAYHVVTGSGTDNTAVLDGVTVSAGSTHTGTGANADGAGIYVDAGSPVIRNCAISANWSDFSGGGAAVLGDAGPSFENCLIEGNSAQWGGGVWTTNGATLTFVECNFADNVARPTGSGGGGVRIETGANAEFTSCSFIGNTGNNGGGMYVGTAHAQIQECEFSDNSVSENGGAVVLSGVSTMSCVSSRFAANAASRRGAAIASHTGSTATIVACWFVGNSADLSGGAIDQSGSGTLADISNSVFTSNSVSVEYGAAIGFGASTMNITNCSFSGNLGNANNGTINAGFNAILNLRSSVVWSNTSGSIQTIQGPTTVSVTFSDIEGGWSGAGTGNINANPLFVNAADPDGLDNLWGTMDDGLALTAASPCIDAGDNAAVPGSVTTDLTGNPRFVDSPHRCDSGFGLSPVVDMGAYENDGAWSTPYVLHVRANAAGGENGLTWTDAFSGLDAALAARNNFWAGCSGTTPPFEIHVAAGTYKPTGGTDRSIPFHLSNLTTIAGGFRGLPGDEGIVDNTTRPIDPATGLPTLASTLSGDIGALGNFSDNSYHVVRSNANDATAILDGVVVSNGNANGAGEDGKGGGLHCTGSPKIRRCTFLFNTGSFGGGMYSITGTPVVSRSVFHGNTASSGGGIYTDGPMEIANTVLRSNAVSLSGGAVLVGSAVFARVTNCVLAGNSAQYGAGFYQVSGATSVVSNCTIHENRQVYFNCTNCGGVGIWSNGGSVNLNNSILWGNRGMHQYAQYNQLYWTAGSFLVNRCLVQGYFGLSGVGNFGDDPRFRDAEGPNNLPGDFDDNLRPHSVSPCLDRGDTNLIAPDTADLDGDSDTTEPTPFDLAGNPRRYDVADVPDTGAGSVPMVDVGAYEFNPEAGDEYICLGGKCLGDLNNDFHVNGLDIPIFLDELLNGGCP